MPKGITQAFRELGIGEQIEVEAYDRPSLYKIARRVGIKVAVEAVSKSPLDGFYVTRVPGEPDQAEKPVRKPSKPKKQRPNKPLLAQKPAVEPSKEEKLDKLRSIVASVEAGVPKEDRPAMYEEESEWEECGTEWNSDLAEMWMMEKHYKTGAIRPKYRVEEEYYA